MNNRFDTCTTNKKGCRNKRQPFVFAGAICRNRTDDLIITSDVLYQLS